MKPKKRDDKTTPDDTDFDFVIGGAAGPEHAMPPEPDADWVMVLGSSTAKPALPKPKRR